MDFSILPELCTHHRSGLQNIFINSLSFNYHLPILSLALYFLYLWIWLFWIFHVNGIYSHRNFYFQMLFKISLSISTKKPIGILIRVVQNLYISLEDLLTLCRCLHLVLFQTLGNASLFTVTACLGHRWARAWMKRKRLLSGFWDWRHGPGS